MRPFIVGRRLAAALLLLALPAACGDGVTEPAPLPADLAGVYHLVSVNDVPVPTPVGDPFGLGRETDFVDGVVEISAGRTFVDASLFHVWYPDLESYDDLNLAANGTVEVDGGDVVFRPYGSETYRMARDGDALVQVWGSFELRYVKEPTPATPD